MAVYSFLLNSALSVRPISMIANSFLKKAQTGKGMVEKGFAATAIPLSIGLMTLLNTM
jgi:hypothetical protein